MSEIKTYDPARVKVTFKGVEVTGFSMDSFIYHDAPWPDSHVPVNYYAPNCRCTLTELHKGAFARYLKWCRRYAIRTKARARKRRRGW